MKIFLILLGIYVLYKFIVDFAIPIYRTSKKVQEQFRNMQNMSENIHSQQQRPAGTSTYAQEPKKNSDAPKDYIDFEEVKD